MSKSFSLPGLRLGWLTCQDAGVLDAVATLKDYTTICSPAPSEVRCAHHVVWTHTHAHAGLCMQTCVCVR